MNKINRRNFIKKTSLSGAAIATASALSSSEYKDRDKMSQYMGDFAETKLDKVKVAFVGVGARGTGHAKQFASIKGTEVVAICDLYKDLAERSKKLCLEVDNQRHKNIKLYHSGENDWIKMIEDTRPDAVFISTNWDNHAPMVIKAMELGSHAFVEVPMATNLKDLWDIVDTSEKTRKHCMMMENVNYGRDELMFLNMCRKGYIGDFLHAEAAYIHELRFQMEEQERGTGSWRTHHYAKSRGNLYPTHGLGPVAQYMNLGRGDDNFKSLVSYSTPGLGRKLYAEKNYSSDHKWNKLEYNNGDLNTSILKTTLGRTVMVQWDETSPRPYSRHNLIQGTKGILAGFPTRVALEGGVEGITKNHHSWAQGDDIKKLYEKYDHPLYKRVGEEARRMGGHGGMDFIMRYRIIECLRQGKPLDQNVYEGCFWSAVTPLSADSIINDGAPQKFPDFTRGNWKSTNKLEVIS
ncbi:MAG: Gfo/Idh/MocA family protein [Cytophagales bacterium]|nr:MAG: alpha-N-acetylgalactosaminidase [Rhodothermaeota bacterium MED-G16]|tara:strand:+ start:3250 stop:4641 length:1392 start_codon:yes stop_codon:yes gene_type:complete